MDNSSNTGAPSELLLESHVFDLDFHPSRNVVAAGTIEGVVQLFEYNVTSPNINKLTLKHHQDACRAVLFSEDGNTLYTASSDCSIRAVDGTGAIEWAELNAHSAPVNKLLTLNAHHSPAVIASGDDDGCVKLWDTRQRSCVMEWQEHTDYISALTLGKANHLLATSGDGRMSVMDIRKKKMVGQSEELEDELLSVVLLKHGQKVICGSQDGVLAIFTYGQWLDMSDRFPGHPSSIDTIIKFDEDTICTGSSDGLIRIVQIHPNKLLGVIGDHDDFPAELIKFSNDKKLIGSISHGNKVNFWDVSYLHEEDDDSEEGDDGAEMMDDDDDSDSDNGHSKKMRSGRMNPTTHLMTSKEEFFSDL